MIVVVDYGMGNLRSVSKALERLGASVRVSSEAAEIGRAKKLILPGVGAFDAAMRELDRRGLAEPIKAFIASGKPYLGICLGLQVLFDSSEEGQRTNGLGVFPGTVRRLAVQPPMKIPHMGWNQVNSVQRTAWSVQNGSPLLKGIPEGGFFYFVHSYYAQPTDRSLVLMESEYGTRFPVMIGRGKTFATQFHPEKSQALGLKLLGNFLSL